jgi:hypothetical protein
MGTLTRMHADREALYADVADITVDSSQPIGSVVRSIVTSLKEGSLR